MALTELQLPDKTYFYNKISAAATKMDKLIHEWEDLAEFVGFLDTSDLDAIGVPTSGDLRSQLVDFRTCLEELTAFYRGTSTTQTVTPGEIADKLRYM